MCNHDIKDLIGTKDGIVCRSCGALIKPEELAKISKKQEAPKPADIPFAQDDAEVEKPAKKPTAKRGRKAAK